MVPFTLLGLAMLLTHPDTAYQMLALPFIICVPPRFLSVSSQAVRTLATETPVSLATPSRARRKAAIVRVSGLYLTCNAGANIACEPPLFRSGFVSLCLSLLRRRPFLILPRSAADANSSFSQPLNRCLFRVPIAFPCVATCVVLWHWHAPGCFEPGNSDSACGSNGLIHHQKLSN